MKKKVYRHDRFTAGEVSASLTSTYTILKTENLKRKLTQKEIREEYYSIVREKQWKGYV